MNDQAASPPGTNPYATQFERRDPAPDLDSHAPELKSSEVQRMNRRALGFLLALVLLLGFTAIWMLNDVLRTKKDVKPKEEVVSVPAAPALPPALPPAAQIEPIAVAPSSLSLPPLPPPSSTPIVAPAGPHSPSLMERRMASAGGTVAVSSGASALMHDPAAGATGLSAGFSPGADQGPPPNAAYRAKPLAAVSNAQPLVHANSLMVRGTCCRAGMSRIDQVGMADDGKRVWAIQGKLSSPLSLIASAPVEQFTTSIEQSSRHWETARQDQFIERQLGEQLAQQRGAQGHEPAAQHHPGGLPQ